ncbi:hypothetical protein PO909_032197 [Leuciscus waleckii]
MEIRKAIKALKGGKAEGPDGIPAEVLKADTETSTNMLHHLMKTIWEEENVPSDWRGIMLLSTPGKMVNHILLKRLQKGVDEKLRENQAGFRNNRSCGDQIATLRINIEQSIEWNLPVYVNFIDFEKAFDSVDRERLWKLMAHYGIPAKIINIIRSTYQGTRCQVLHEGCISEAWEGGTEDDVQARIRKARTTFNMLNNIWKAKNLSLKTKLQIFNSNVKTTLLYGSETWRITTTILNKL